MHWWHTATRGISSFLSDLKKEFDDADLHLTATNPLVTRTRIKSSLYNGRHVLHRPIPIASGRPHHLRVRGHNRVYLRQPWRRERRHFPRLSAVHTGRQLHGPLVLREDLQHRLQQVCRTCGPPRRCGEHSVPWQLVQQWYALRFRPLTQHWRFVLHLPQHCCSGLRALVLSCRVVALVTPGEWRAPFPQQHTPSSICCARNCVNICPHARTRPQ